MLLRASLHSRTLCIVLAPSSEVGRGALIGMIEPFGARGPLYSWLRQQPHPRIQLTDASIRMLRVGQVVGPPFCEHDSRAGCGGFDFSTLLQQFLFRASAVPATGTGCSCYQARNSVPVTAILVPLPARTRVGRGYPVCTCIYGV